MDVDGYRFDIDGLRALAVLGVILYHAGYLGVRGGFVGVDVFFVISGFLITGIIDREISEGSFTFAGFYQRRVRRLLPALLTMLTVCTAFAALAFSPIRFAEYGKGLAAIAGFGGNFYFLRLDPWSGYFGTNANSQILLHTWSLAVEEQFYLVFPALLVLLAKLKRPQQKLIIAVCFVLSLTCSEWYVSARPITGFYLLSSRMWEFLLGAMLSLRVLSEAPRSLRECGGAVGLGMICYSAFRFDDHTRFPGLHALIPCLGAAMLLYCGEDGCLVSKLLSARPLVWIGVLSYSLYLWHWPILFIQKFYLARNFLTVDDMRRALLVTFVIAYLSFVFIESFFRQRRSPVLRGTPTIAWGAGFNVLFAIVGLSIAASQGFPNHLNPNTRRILTLNDERANEYPKVEAACNNYQLRVNRLSDVNFCEIRYSSKNVLFWGDSHVEQLYPLIENLEKDDELEGRGAVFAMAGGCPPSATLNRTDPHYYCDSFARFALERAKSNDIQDVFIQFLPWWTGIDGTVCLAENGRCVRSITGVDAGLHIIAEMGRNVRELKANGKRVIIGLPFPYYSLEIPKYEIRNAVMGRFAPKKEIPYELTKIEFQEAYRREVVAAGAEIFDPRQTLCPQMRCFYDVDGVSLYFDSGHLAMSQVSMMRDSLLHALQAPH